MCSRAFFLIFILVFVKGNYACNPCDDNNDDNNSNNNNNNHSDNVDIQ